MKHVFITAILGFTLVACSNMGSGTQSGRTDFEIRAHSYDALFEAANETLKQLGLTITSSDRGRGEIRAKSGMSAFSWGEYIAVHITKMPEQGDSYRLRIENDRAVSFNVSAKDWSPLIVDGIKKKLSSY